MLGKTDFDFYPEERARPAYEDEQEIIRTGQPSIGKLEHAVQPDGKVNWRHHHEDALARQGWEHHRHSSAFPGT